ncbi:MAG: AAA family ATPase, partial [Dehalococcoidia bacterium]
MVPARLTLRNFLSYAEDCPPIDLEEIGLACLCGDNGHGKSSLIDAITWALWGRARGRDLDALVHRGRRSMEVDFEFLSGPSRYRVVRRRQRIGVRGAGRPSLEFQVWNGAGWSALTEPTIAQTEQAIERTIHLAFETFINSALLLQGKADLFASTGAANRKRVLADILDLGKYDRFETEAKERRRRRQQDVDRYERELESIRAKLAPAGELNDRLRLALLELRTVAGQQAALTDELMTLQNARTAFDATTMALADLERQIAADVPALREAEAELVTIDATLTADASLHAAGPAIQRGYERLERARATEREWSAKLIEAQRLDQRMQPLYQQRASTDSRHQARSAVLQAQHDEAMRQAGQLSTLDARALELQHDMRSMETLEARADLIKEQLSGHRELLVQLRGDELGLRQTQRGLEGQYRTLHRQDGGAVQCPVCGGTLTPEAAGRLLEEVCNQLRQISDKRGEMGRAIRAADDEISRLSDEEAYLRRRVRSES